MQKKAINTNSSKVLPDPNQSKATKAGIKTRQKEAMDNFLNRVGRFVQEPLKPKFVQNKDKKGRSSPKPITPLTPAETKKLKEIVHEFGD